MNEKKISFIFCVNDREAWKTSLRHIEELEVPEGYEIEILGIFDAASMTAGYNEAMGRTDAKYKVYLHQDVHILNRRFIKDALPLFQRHPQIGLIGVIGTAKLPQSGMWWESDDNYGLVYGSHSGKMELLSFQQNGESAFQRVAAVDGLLMITQYDLYWREDLFKGWHYYDLSQCMEFRRAGYEIAIPFQAEPWALHDCGVADLTGFEENRLLFVNEYEKEIKEQNRLKERDSTLEEHRDVRISQLLETVKGTEGFLMDLEIMGLLQLPAWVDHLPGAIVEIGSFKGKSTIALAKGSQLLTTQKRPVWAIDPFSHPALAPYKEGFKANIHKAGIDSVVNVIKKPSQEAYADCPEAIAALFIDGDHSYEGVVHDIIHYASRVVPGGIIAFHDYSYRECPGYEWAELPGVTQAVDEMCAQDAYEYVCDYISLRLVRKRG